MKFGSNGRILFLVLIGFLFFMGFYQAIPFTPRYELSMEYWGGTKPFAIITAVYNSNGTLNIEILNNGLDQLTLQRINFTYYNSYEPSINYLEPVSLKPNEPRMISVNAKQCNQSGEFSIEIGYDSSSYTNLVQKGARNLWLPCDKVISLSEIQGQKINQQILAYIEVFLFAISPLMLIGLGIVYYEKRKTGETKRNWIYGVLVPFGIVIFSFVFLAGILFLMNTYP